MAHPRNSGSALKFLKNLKSKIFISKICRMKGANNNKHMLLNYLRTFVFNIFSVFNTLHSHN